MNAKLTLATSWRTKADALRNKYRDGSGVPFSVECCAVAIETCAQELEDAVASSETRLAFDLPTEPPTSTVSSS